jgi:hypothetical protein
MPKGLQDLLGMINGSTVITHSSDSLAASFRAMESDITFVRQPGDYYQTDLLPSMNLYVVVRQDQKFFPPFKCIPTHLGTLILCA